MTISLAWFFVILIFSCVCIGFAVYFYTLTRFHTKPTSCEFIQEEYFKIPIDTEEGMIEFKARITRSHITPKSAPCVIVCHGWGMDLNEMKYIQEPLALHGYAIVAYSSRGHGKSGGDRDFPEIYGDVIKVIDHLQKNSELGIDSNRIAVIGHSMGASVSLMFPYLDERVKVVVGISGMHDTKESFEMKRSVFSLAYWIKIWLKLKKVPMNLTEEINEWASPKFYLKRPSNTEVCLIHTRDDPFVDFMNFEKNVTLLDLPQDHTLIFKKGGHALFHLECMMTSQVIKWLHDYL